MSDLGQASFRRALQLAIERLQRVNPLAAILIAGLAFDVWASYQYAYPPQFGHFDELARTAGRIGLPALYFDTHGFFASTAPGNPVLALALAWLHATSFPDWLGFGWAYPVIVRSPNIASDLALAIVVFCIADRVVSRSEALGATAIAALAPWLVIPATTLDFEPLGHFDGPAQLSIVLALASTLRKRIDFAWLALGIGALFSVYPLFAAPLVLAEQVQMRDASRRTLLAIAAVLATWAIVSAPFAGALDPLEWLVRRYEIALDPHAWGQWIGISSAWSMSASNSDSRHQPSIFGVSASVVDWAALAATYAAVIFFSTRNINTTTEVRRTGTLVGAWSLIFIALVVLPVNTSFAVYTFEMPMTPLLWSGGRWQRQVAAAIVTTWFAAMYLMGELAKKGASPAQIFEAVHLIATLNVAIFIYALVAFAIDTLRSRPRVAADRLRPIRLP